MYFYRPLGKIDALTFDLDDTLYDNQPVIKQAEEDFLQYLQQRYSFLGQITAQHLQQNKIQAKQQQPDIDENVTLWRWMAVHLLLKGYNLTEQESQVGADDAIEYFMSCRNKIVIEPQTHQVLSVLAERFPLAVITNGNANPTLFGLADYFAFVLYAGQNGRAKPYGDMFYEAAHRFKLPSSSLLHVGDDLATDIAGAIDSGTKACWINTSSQGILANIPARLLPDIEIKQLSALLDLL